MSQFIVVYTQHEDSCNYCYGETRYCYELVNTPEEAASFIVKNLTERDKHCVYQVSEIDPKIADYISAKVGDAWKKCKDKAAAWKQLQDKLSAFNEAENKIAEIQKLLAKHGTDFSEEAISNYNKKIKYWSTRKNTIASEVPDILQYIPEKELTYNVFAQMGITYKRWQHFKKNYLDTQELLSPGEKT